VIDSLYKAKRTPNDVVTGGAKDFFAIFFRRVTGGSGRFEQSVPDEYGLTRVGFSISVFLLIIASPFIPR